MRLAFAFVGSLVLMLAFGFGITTDVENIRLAALDLDQTPESRAYLAEFESSPSFLPAATAPQPAGNGTAAAGERHLAGDRDADGVRSQLQTRRESRGLRRGRRGQPVSRRDDQAIRRRSVNQLYRHPEPQRHARRRSLQRHGSIQSRYLYNPSFESIYAIVPSIPPILLILIPAILMAVSVVREKELGSIINFYVTPTTRLEFLLGKQLPYIAIGMINYVILMLMAIVVFQVPLKGSGLTLTLCALAVRDRDHRDRPPGLDLHAQPGRRGLRDRDPDHPADDSILGTAAAGLDPGRAAPSWARSGRRLTTCTRASGPSRRRSARGCSRATSWPWPSSSRC